MAVPKPFENRDDPGLRLRIEEPQISRTLSHGSVFDLSIAEKLKLISCLMNQVLTYYDIRDSMEESLEQFKHAKVKLRALQAEEKRKETEDHLWKTRLLTDRVVPDPNSLKAGSEYYETENEKTIDPKNILE